MTAMVAFAWLVSAMAMAFVLSALGAAAPVVLRAPARRVRAIELTLLACLLAPWLPGVPGLPRLEWRDFLASNATPDRAAVPQDSAPTLELDAAPAKPLMAKEPIAIPLQGAFAASEKQLPDELEVESVASPAALASDEAMFDESFAAGPSELVETRDAMAAAVPIELAPAMTASEPNTPAAAETIDWRALAIALYVAGVATVLLLDAFGGLALLRVWKSSTRADVSVEELLEGIAGRKLGRVSVLVSPRCRQPFTFAWLWPVIVLPPALVVRGKERELRWALAHE